MIKRISLSLLTALLLQACLLEIQVDDQTNTVSESTVNYFDIQAIIQEEGGVEQVTVTNEADHGSVFIDSAGGASYTPREGYVGHDRFSYTFQNNKGQKYNGDVYLRVGPKPDLGARDILTPAVSRYGTALNELRFFRNDQIFRDTLVREFNTITMESYHKWWALARERGVYDFSKADVIMDFVEAHDMEVKGHAMLWYIADPKFVKDAWDQPDLMRDLIGEHIDTVLTHYKGRIKDWDLVIEVAASQALIENAAEDDPRYRNSAYYQAMGPEYVSFAYRRAREIDPELTLWINDYNIEKATHKSDNLYSIVDELLADGVPIDGIGFQSHVVFDHSPLELLNNMQRFADLGLKVNISEIDVPMADFESAMKFLVDKILVKKELPHFFDLMPFPTIGRTEEDQKRYYANYGLACAVVEACNWVTQWGITDDASWMKEWSKPLPYNPDYSRKPAYYSLISGMTGNAEFEEPSNGALDAIDAPVGSLIEYISGYNL